MIVQNVGHGGATDLSFTIPRVELAKAKRILEPLIRELGFREMTTDSSVAKVSIVGAGIQNAPGYAARMFGTLADAGINIEMISTSEIRITTIIAEDRVEEAVRALHAAFELERARERARRGGRRRELSRVTGVRRHEPRVLAASSGSTASARRTTSSATGSRQASPEVCVAVADEQTAGRGRNGPHLDRAARRRAAAARSASGPPGSRRTARGGSPRPSRSRCATRPRTRPGLPVGAVRLKWPNDLVIETGGPKALLVGELSPEGAAARLAAPLELRKLAGVLGESRGPRLGRPARRRRDRDQRATGPRPTSRPSSPPR